MNEASKTVAEENSSINFIEEIIREDIRNTKHGGRIHTRFPPEPNGYLHIGHAKAICLSFGIATKYNGKCNLRFDDTNPVKEDEEYIHSIRKDVKWLGFDWQDREYFTSDYFEMLYGYAVQLIEKGKAYICDMSFEEIAAGRGTPTVPGQESPFRNRPTEENLRLFEQMKQGAFKDGAKVLRAKIDMASPNMHMRDPVLYRIKHARHHRTGDTWCIYPMYDFAHGQSDAIEGITHSLCTLEFEVHRPLYDWFIKELGLFPSRQIEFARLNLTYTVMSKRKLLLLVENGHVSGWDDPRMPTISGMRRRGYPPSAIRNFAERIGIAKRENMIDVALLEHCVREELNKTANRVMVVMNPLKVIITNYPEGQAEQLEAINNPEDEHAGTRTVPFGRELYIERDDFMEDAPKKFFRLSLGTEVRLRYAYYITCHQVIKDERGQITALHCTYDPETTGGQSADNRKVKGTLHWVSASDAIPVETRLYDRLFTKENPDETENQPDFRSHLNPDSLSVVTAMAEPSVKVTAAGALYQFERIGYFAADKETTAGRIIFNRTVSLKDSWSKVSK